jgi:hypothetical protein
VVTQCSSVLRASRVGNSETLPLPWNGHAGGFSQPQLRQRMNIALGGEGVADPPREAARSAMHAWQAYVRYFATPAGRMWCQAKLSREGQERCRQGIPSGVAEACRASSPEWPQGIPTCRRFTRAMRVPRSRTPARLYVYDPIFEGLAQDLQDVAAELRPFIQKEHPMVRPRHLARHGHVVSTDQSSIRDGLVGGAKRAGRDQRRAVASEAGDTVDVCRLHGLGRGHGR